MLTVSIVTYNTPLGELGQCLDSLGVGVVERVFVVDNSRSDDIMRFCHQRANVEYVQSDNRGYGAGHNQGIARGIGLGADYHLVINSDIYFTPSILCRIMEYMDREKDVAMVHPAVFYPDGRLQYTSRLLPRPIDVFSRRFLPGCLVRGINRRYLLEQDSHTIPFDCPYHQGSFMMLRVGALKDTGVFDERFFMYPEDIDLTRRLHRNYRTMFWPDVSIVHCHRAASYGSMKMTWIHVKNMIMYFNKWGWLFDRERRAVNREVLKGMELRKKCGPQP